MTRLSNVLYTINSDPVKTLELDVERHNTALGLSSKSRRRIPRVYLFHPSSYSCNATTVTIVANDSACDIYTSPCGLISPASSAQLTVFPQGHEFLDDIIVSALAVERKLVMQ
ncbi:hypothetical protein BDQ17DRAFT_1546959 [Cyathus striatus]|nr:hypothetical protein BDQ17DRAFT_1546959 [Cyathus striatus]